MPVLKDENELVYGKWRYTFQYVPIEEVTIQSDRSKAYLDLEKLKFPLLLQKWSQGDRMQPYGMHGQKKISDMLINEKIPNVDKSAVHVLRSGQEVIWLCGIRIGHTCRVTNETKNVLVIEQKPVKEY